MALHLLTLPTGTMPQWISNAQTAAVIAVHRPQSSMTAPAPTNAIDAAEKIPH